MKSSLSNPYNNRQWRKLRLSHLQSNPLCYYCLPNKITEATQVDHCIPWTDENDLMYEEDNLLSTCARCHQWITGKQRGMDFKGMSFDEAKVYKKTFIWQEVGEDGYY